jgi:hypothetical protein
MPFGAQLAGLQEDRRAVLVGMLTDNEADPTLAYKPRQALLAIGQRQSAPPNPGPDHGQYRP